MIIDIEKEDKVVITIQDGKMRILLNNKNTFYPKAVSIGYIEGLEARIKIEGENNELYNNS